MDNINDNDDSIKFIPLVPLENHMNDGDQERLLKYLDPEFLDAIPDENAIDMELLAMEFKEKLNLILEAEDTKYNADDPQDKESTIIMTPREYQYELFQKAIKENIIAILGTGAGKTLISVMLIKHMSLIERQQRLVRRETKLSFFLVSLVPLVFQQAKVIQANCDINLQEICGSMNVDSWTENQWEPIFENNDVCVMTAQVFLDVLRHGFIKLNQVNLIIFDECHHALKKHPFNLIMREFYDRCSPESRPKIFGMTASPVINSVNIINSITTLEKNLDCLAYTAINIKELDVVLPKPDEYVLSYDPPPFYTDSNLGLRNHLGPWCGDKRLLSFLTDVSSKISFEGLDDDLLVEEELQIKEALNLCKYIKSERNPDISDLTRFSPKVSRLISSLKCESQQANFCAIIFVERRDTALALHDLIKSIDDLNHIKPAVMTGHGSAEEGDMHMTYTQQNKIIQAFKENEIKLLIATNVAEEGLDMQPCNYVYRFDQLRTLISYIQSRGRARSQNSKYILFSERTNTNHTNALLNLQKQEEELKKFCSTMPSERNVASKFSFDITEDLSLCDDSDSEEYLENALYIPETDALITMQNAIPLIHRYCNALPSDSYFYPKPIFEFDYMGGGIRCCLHMPSNAPFTKLYSPMAKSKGRAKMLVSLKACKKLRSLRLLDGHLKPFGYRSELLGDMVPEVDSNGMAIGSKRRHNVYEKRTPKLWERNVEMDDEAVEIEDDADLLKARKKMDVEDLDISNKQKNQTENVVDPLEDFLGNDKKLIGLDIQHKQCDNDGDLIMFDENETPNENTTDNDVLGEGPFGYWASIFEVTADGNIINGVPYRQLCIMTRKPMPTLPQINLMNEGQQIHVKVHTINIEIRFNKEHLIHLCNYMFNVMKTLLNKDFTCPLEDVPYFILPLVNGNIHQLYNSLTKEDLEKLIDWVEISNIVQLKNDHFTLDSELLMKDIILIDCSNYERKYIIDNINHDINPTSPVPTDITARESGYSSFQEYYVQNKKKPPINLDSSMILARQIRKKLNYITASNLMEPKIKGGTYAWLAPEFCKKYYMHLGVYQALLIVPALMIRVDSLLLLKEAKMKFGLHIQDELMLEAYTAPSASMEMNYERLEILGDSILKLLSTISLYVNFSFKDEGQLHVMRIRIVCNKALYRAAKRLKFYRYITSHAFNSRYWRPPHFTSIADNLETMEYLRYHELSDKMLADMVESSLGAAYISGGLECALHTAIQMRIPLDNITCWSHIFPIYRNSRKGIRPRVELSALSRVDMQKINEIVGYDFKNPLLVVEALTHGSLPDSQVPCYQRLEFLGDAILDFLVVRYLYYKYTKADPGKIAELKDSCVNNHILAVICLETGLYKHIIHYSGRIIQSIRDFENQIREIQASDKCTGEYWREVNTPKVLSDVVESVLGAVFVDAGFDLKPIEVLFEKWFMETFEEHISPGNIVCHPITKLTHTFQRFGCEGFKIRNITSERTDADSQKAVIFLHDQALSNGASSNIKMARRHAATRALQRLEDEPNVLNDVCNCRISLLKKDIGTKALDSVINEDNDDEGDN
ncbi:dicer-2 protein [Backusella circina FSU 941]|nr:dicer-2 protein [Backusella circina FSU 941]